MRSNDRRTAITNRLRDRPLGLVSRRQLDRCQLRSLLREGVELSPQAAIELRRRRVNYRSGILRLGCSSHKRGTEPQLCPSRLPLIKGRAESNDCQRASFPPALATKKTPPLKDEANNTGAIKSARLYARPDLPPNLCISQQYFCCFLSQGRPASHYRQ
jgi:hypothetical protein